jgi:hypothetical protein
MLNGRTMSDTAGPAVADGLLVALVFGQWQNSRPLQRGVGRGVFAVLCWP